MVVDKNMSQTEISLEERPVRSQQTDDVYDDGYLRIEHKNYYLACGGHSLKLPRTEFLIISRLASAAGRIVTAQDLWKYAWGSSKPLNTESLHVYIYRLRNKLAPFNLQIDTTVNVGYRLVIDVAVSEAAKDGLPVRR